MIRVRGWGAGSSYDVPLRSLNASSPRGNFEWTVSGLPVRKNRRIVADLLRVARAVHLADRLVRRGSSIHGYLRRMRVDIGVSEPARWRRVSPLLEELAEFATGGDTWSFGFLKGAEDGVVPDRAGAARNGHPSVIALFSGGLDSLCGAAFLAAADGVQPCFVSHSPPGRRPIEELIRATFQSFGRKLDGGVGVTYRLEVREENPAGTRSMFQEPTRRTRPFYFLAMACATALAADVPCVQMSENGALALSLPYRADVHGPAMARQAHTFLLAGFEQLLSELVPGLPWRVTNPFVNETKGEACLRLGPASGLAALTASCEYLGRQRAVIENWKQQHPRRSRILGEGPHCGLCVPCIVRRAALKRAKISDPDANYYGRAPEILSELSRKGTALAYFGGTHAPPLINMLVPNIVYMERHCTWLRSSSLTEFAIRYLPELRAGRPISGAPIMTVETHHALAKRYAREILDFLHG